jgi:hypothetical protein
VSLGVVVALALLGGPAVAHAQRLGQAPHDRPINPDRAVRTFGPTARTSHTLQAFAFTGLAAADSAAFGANVLGSRFCVGTPCSYEAALFLPAGALVTSIELEACDTSISASVTATLFTQAPREGGLFKLAEVSTGDAQTPGCNFFEANLSVMETVDNFSNTYQVEVFINGTNNTTRFQAVRVYYNLQVSPAPPAATFNDVPTTHPFFQWIEAFAAAGITTGCSVAPPLYCPDNFVTRGQMAVFISKALGLEFAP